MRYTSAEFAVEVSVRHAVLDASAFEGFVLPIVALGILADFKLHVRHQGLGLCLTETLCDKRLRHVVEKNPFAVLNRRSRTELSPRRSGKATLQVGYWIPAEPVRHVISGCAGRAAIIEAVFIVERSASADDARREIFVQLDADGRVDLVVERITRSVKREAHAYIRSEGDGVSRRAPNRRALFDVVLEEHVRLFDRLKISRRRPELSGQRDCIEFASLKRMRRAFLRDDSSCHTNQNQNGEYVSHQKFSVSFTAMNGLQPSSI